MKHRRNPLPAILGILALGALTCGIPEDDLQCEEAASHMANCCPGFDPKRLGCATIPGCYGDGAYPLPIQTSKCITDMSCDQIVAKSLCTQFFSGGLQEVCP